VRFPVLHTGALLHAKRCPPTTSDLSELTISEASGFLEKCCYLTSASIRHSHTMTLRAWRGKSHEHPSPSDEAFCVDFPTRFHLLLQNIFSFSASLSSFPPKKLTQMRFVVAPYIIRISINTSCSCSIFQVFPKSHEPFIVLSYSGDQNIQKILFVLLTFWFLH